MRNNMIETEDENLLKDAHNYVMNYHGWGWRPHEGSDVYYAMKTTYVDVSKKYIEKLNKIKSLVERLYKMNHRMAISKFNMDDLGIDAICERIDLEYEERYPNEILDKLYEEVNS